MVTRCCARDEFLLQPGELSNAAVWYCLAEAAKRCDMEVLWFMACSNHLHMGIHDRHGKYPKFIEHLHKMIGRLLNALWGRRGNLFEVEQTSVVELVDAAAIFDKLIYSLTNPVKDQLVKRADHWPGATSLAYHLDDEELVAPRPAWFFSKRTTMPKEVRLRFVRPEPFAHLTHEEWADMIRAAVARRERAAEDERRRTGRTVLGVQAVLAQRFDESPNGSPPGRRKNKRSRGRAAVDPRAASDPRATINPRPTINPRAATRNKWRRVEVLQRNRAFLRAYAAALRDYRAGQHDVIFPPGTWKLYEEGHVLRHAA